MRVAIVHDDLVQWGGAERVLEGICEIYPEAPIFTSVFDRSNKELVKRFGDKKIITSFLNTIPYRSSAYKLLLPLYPIAFEQFNFDGYDLVISHTTRFAKSIITKPKATHICYCHTPPRFLWHFSNYKANPILEVLMSKLRIYDQVVSHRVDYFIAGSQNAKKRIQKIYRADSKVVYPFVDFQRFENVDTFDGGYAVIIARKTEYKRVDLAEKACLQLGIPLKIIQGDLEDEDVVSVLAGCKFLIITAVEDFGISALEAQALGKMVIAYKEGGVLETVIENKTGIFFNDQSVSSLREAILKGVRNFKKEDAINNARKFTKDIFLKEFKSCVDSLLYL